MLGRLSRPCLDADGPHPHAIYLSEATSTLDASTLISMRDLAGILIVRRLSCIARHRRYMDVSEMIRALVKAATLFKPREFGVSREACALCGFRAQVRLCQSEIAVRCLRCGASAVTQSLVDVLVRECAQLSALDVYELSAEGPLVHWLQSHTGRLTTSEYLTDIPGGSERAGITCQDVQRLTYEDQSFDLCTSTEVFEHVEDDMRGFNEIFRVLRPGGLHVFTVPLNLGGVTVERTELVVGQRINRLPVEYHADRYRGRRVFCYRNYGVDLVDRLATAGFVDVEFRRPQRTMFGFARPVVVARKPSQAKL